jgi:valyl-tRNA synthetase
VDWIADETATLTLLVGAKQIEVNADYQPEKGVPAAVTPVGELYMPLEGLIDIEEETKRLEKEIAKVTAELDKADKKLTNPNFVERAKPEIVEEHRNRRADWQKKLEQLNEMLGNLKA